MKTYGTVIDGKDFVIHFEDEDYEIVSAVYMEDYDITELIAFMEGNKDAFRDHAQEEMKENGRDIS